MHLSFLAGTTSKIVQVPVYDSSSTTGGMLTGLAFNTSSLVCWYNREGAAGSATQISLLTATKGTWTTAGFVAVDGTNMPGWYELHIPNAAIASGAKSVAIELRGAANMVPCNIIIELTAFDNQDAVRAGLTSLPNVASGSSGAIPTTGTGSNQISVSSGLVSVTGDLTSTMKTSVETAVWDAQRSSHVATGTFGQLGLGILRDNTATAGAAGTITLDASASTTADFFKGSLIAIYGGTGAGQAPRMISAYSTGRVATVAPNWTVTPDNTSKFIILAFDDPPIVGSDGKVLVSADSHTSGETIVGMVYPTGTVVSNGSNTASTFKTDRTESTNDYWKDALLEFSSGGLVGQVKKISAYDGTTKFVTLSSAFTAAPSAADAFQLVNR